MRTTSERTRRIGMVGLTLSCGAALGAIATIVTDARGGAVAAPRPAIENLRADVRSGAADGFYLRLDYEVIPRRDRMDVVPALDARCEVGARTYVELVRPEPVQGVQRGRTFVQTTWLWAETDGTLPAEPTRCSFVFHDAARTSFCFTPPARLVATACTR